MFGHFFDVDGNFCRTSIDDRVIAVSESDIFNIDYRIGAAGGISKYKAILGVLKKRIVNIIDTDDKVAELLI